MEPSELIDKQIAGLGDWRGHCRYQVRKIINDAAPDIKEEWKWGTAMWSRNGNVCALGAFKDHLKLNFFKGASLEDPHGLFNGGLDAKQSRSVDFHKSDAIDESGLKDLVSSAAAYNKGQK